LGKASGPHPERGEEVSGEEKGKKMGQQICSIDFNLKDPAIILDNKGIYTR
jgi:hypothetical protein